MSSRKPSAKAKQVERFKSQLGDLGAAFEREAQRADERAQKKEAALRAKACESKNRYSCKSDAEAAIRSCAEHGTKGLHCYRCPYCNGWHLTSKPV